MNRIKPRHRKPEDLSTLPAQVIVHVRIRPQEMEYVGVTLDSICAATLALGSFDDKAPLKDIYNIMTYVYTHTPPPHKYWRLDRLARDIVGNAYWNEHQLGEKSDLQLFQHFLFLAEEELGPRVAIKRHKK